MMTGDEFIRCHEGLGQFEAAVRLRTFTTYTIVFFKRAVRLYLVAIVNTLLE